MKSGPSKETAFSPKANFFKKKSPAKISTIKTCLNDMERSWGRQKSMASIWKNWSEIAGSPLSENCQPLSLHNEILFVGASHPQWRQALLYNRSQLIAALRASGNKVKDIRIKQHYPEDLKEYDSEQKAWEKHPSRIDIHGLSNCKICNCPSPNGEIKLWGKCSFCRRKEL